MVWDLLLHTQKGNADYTAMTTLTLNNEAYSHEKYWTYWDNKSATKRTATFIIPIKREQLLDGENIIQLIAGRYKNAEGSIQFDNSLFQSIELV
ncbi:MAG: hypothetical protein HQK84_12025 [Nitrospinae bacterium]|nr:hypothetical protein [Nitrospinota bacterium]